MTQLEQDLERRIDEKLHKWVQDSFDLYDMANIEHEAYFYIMKCLLRALCSGLAEAKAEDAYCCQLILMGMKRARLAEQRLHQSR